jgi:hypothetical protein
VRPDHGRPPDGVGQPIGVAALGWTSPAAACADQLGVARPAAGDVRLPAPGTWGRVGDGSRWAPTRGSRQLRRGAARVFGRPAVGGPPARPVRARSLEPGCRRTGGICGKPLGAPRPALVPGIGESAWSRPRGSRPLRPARDPIDGSSRQSFRADKQLSGASTQISRVRPGSAVKASVMPPSRMRPVGSGVWPARSGRFGPRRDGRAPQLFATAASR